MKTISLLLMLFPSICFGELVILTSCGDDVYYLYRSEKKLYILSPDSIRAPSTFDPSKTWLNHFMEEIKRGRVITRALEKYSPNTICGTLF